MTSAREMGAFIRSRREELGLAQADLAAALGVTRAQVSNLERGTSGPSFKLLVRLVRLLGFGVVRLLEQDESPTQDTILHRDKREPATLPFAEAAEVQRLSLESGTRISPYEVVIQPGGGLLPHRESAEELLLLLEGSVELRFDGQPRAIEQGSSYVYPSGSDIQVTNVGDLPARLLLLELHQT